MLMHNKMQRLAESARTARETCRLAGHRWGPALPAARPFARELCSELRWQLSAHKGTLSSLIAALPGSISALRAAASPTRSAAQRDKGTCPACCPAGAHALVSGGTGWLCRPCWPGGHETESVWRLCLFFPIRGRSDGRCPRDTKLLSLFQCQSPSPSPSPTRAPLCSRPGQRAALADSAQEPCSSPFSCHLPAEQQRQPWAPRQTCTCPFSLAQSQAHISPGENNREREWL